MDIHTMENILKRDNEDEEFGGAKMGRKKKQPEEYRLLPDGQISMRCGVPMPRKYLRLPIWLIMQSNVKTNM